MASLTSRLVQGFLGPWFSRLELRLGSELQSLHFCSKQLTAEPSPQLLKTSSNWPLYEICSAIDENIELPKDLGGRLRARMLSSLMGEWATYSLDKRLTFMVTELKI